MIYAINKRTKEHRLYQNTLRGWTIFEKDWRLVECDADGWIPWEGGE